MIRTTYRFKFDRTIQAGEIHRGLMLSLIAVEGIHGESATQIDGKFNLYEQDRVCIIDAETPVGSDLAKIFARFMNMFCGGCFSTEFVECKAPQSDILDLCGILMQ